MMGQRLWAGTALLFVFALGSFAGAFYERHHVARPVAALSGAEMHEAVMADLQEALGLDEQQVEQIHAILADRQELVQRVWEEVRPQVQSAVQEIHTEIAELLRPEQRQAYHDWLNRQRDESGDDRAMIIH